MTSTCPTAANHFHWRTPACSILKYSGIPTAECQLCPGLIPSSACVVGRSWGLESCCAAPHWEQGRTLQSQGPRVPRAGHRIPGKHKHRDQPNTATGPSLPSAEILHESQHREQVRPALSHSCAVSTDTDPGKVLSIPSRPCQHHEAPRALPQGSSSPLLLTFSKPLQQGCPHSRGSSLQERPSWCTGAHPGCETLLRSQPPSFPPQSSGSSSRLCSGDTGAGHSASTELPQVLQIPTKPRGKLRYRNRTWNVTFIVSKITFRSLQSHTSFCSGVFAPCWAGLCSGPGISSSQAGMWFLFQMGIKCALRKGDF